MRTPKESSANWRDFCHACTGMTLQQIEKVAGAPWGTILAWSVEDQIPLNAYLAVRDFEERQLPEEE